MNKIINVLLGCLVTSIGTIILQHSHLVVGGTAGLSLILSYNLHKPFYILFFIVNLPFYIFSFMRMGWKFTASTFFAITALCFMTGAERWLSDFNVLSLIGAVVGGGLTGLGLSILFANGSSLGGANILALYLQKKCGCNPGKITFIFDAVVVLFGIYSIGLAQGLYSILSIIIINTIIASLDGRIFSGNTSKNSAATTI